MVTKGKVVNAGMSPEAHGKILRPVMASPVVSRQAMPHM